MKTDTETTLHITGPPRRLRLVDSLFSESLDVQLFTKKAFGEFTKGQILPCRVRKFSKERPLDLRVKLPANTKPGNYPAKLETGKESHSVIIRVEESTKLKHYPGQLRFSAKPGGKISQKVSFENQGNITTTLPKDGIGNLYLDSGIPEAVASTLQSQADDGDDFFKHLLLKLRDGYGGLIKIKFIADDFELKPGEKKTYSLEGRLPKNLKTGERYFGIWHVADFHFLINVKVDG